MIDDRMGISDSALHDLRMAVELGTEYTETPFLGIARWRHGAFLAKSQMFDPMLGKKGRHLEEHEIC